MHRVPDDAMIIDSKQLSGIVSYDPQEFVISVLAGTSIAEVQQSLSEKSQYLPFDPLLAQKGATMGGTVAANANGPGRFRFGGIRDFLIGARFIDGLGTSLRTGGKVVKNAAGFDYPKLLVGSRGKLGVLCELTFKVFPKPESFATLECSLGSIGEAIQLMTQFANGSHDLEAIELVPTASNHYKIALRIGGLSSAIPSRIGRLRQQLPVAKVIEGQEEAPYWDQVKSFDWAHCTGERSVLKVPITPSQIGEMERCLEPFDVNRRYSVAGNVVWIAIEPSRRDLLLVKLNSAPHAKWNVQTFLGDASAPQETSSAFGRLIRSSLDPHGKFL
jgi:glycolate oxidase FAD binding subunit